MAENSYTDIKRDMIKEDIIVIRKYVMQWNIGLSKIA